MSNKPVLYNIGGSIFCSECTLAIWVAVDDIRNGYLVHPVNERSPCSASGKKFRFITCAVMEECQ